MPLDRPPTPLVQGRHPRRRTLRLPLLLSCLAGAAPARAAAILYTATDLGSGIDLKRNADGSTYGITNAAGDTTYAFT